MNLMPYRSDIDGLRALAVISVVLFHLGYLPNGYLGVDIFFAISGFLITGIVYKKTESGEFSLLDFYQRRIRRIFPLLLFTTSIALILGLIFMLPDDLDNLSQSVFASNFSVNNILMLITSSDYWAVKNEYKPLMHTWSLGIEEQFYLIYPLIFLFLQGNRNNMIWKVILLLTLISLFLFLGSENPADKFYLLHFRFFEFMIGGLGALFISHQKIKATPIKNWILVFSAILLIILLASPNSDYKSLKILGITLLSTTILIVGNVFYQTKNWYAKLFSNRATQILGKSSFSIYMMHQVVFAFSRYAFFEKITPLHSLLLLSLTFGVSSLTYLWIEKPFRSPIIFSFRKVSLVLVPVFLISTFSSLYIYSIGGLIKDLPSLDLYKNNPNFERKLFKISSNIHIQYNEDVRKLDRDFEATTKKKILVFGNSYGRDVANILLESDFKEDVQIRYFDIARTFKDEQLKRQILEADFIFFAAYGIFGMEWINSIETKHGLQLNREKIWTFGIKDFGAHNGIHYNRIQKITDFKNYRSAIKDGVLEKNELLKTEWEGRYIDLIGPIINGKGQVLVFTPNGKFLSPDTVHLTKAGAKYFAEILSEKLKTIIKPVSH